MGVSSLFHAFGHGVDLSDGVEQRFFADDMFAGVDGLVAHGPVGRGRGADVDDIDVVPGNDLIEGFAVFGDVETVGKFLGAGIVEGTDYTDVIEMGEAGKSDQMKLCYAGANDRDI